MLLIAPQLLCLEPEPLRLEITCCVLYWGHFALETLQFTRRCSKIFAIHCTSAETVVRTHFRNHRSPFEITSRWVCTPMPPYSALPSTVHEYARVHTSICIYIYIYIYIYMRGGGGGGPCATPPPARVSGGHGTQVTAT